MIKITQAPKEPILAQKPFSISGVASLDHVSKNLILSVDNQLNLTGPVVDREGSWRIDFSFQQPGNHQLKIAINNERVDVKIQVIPRVIESKELHPSAATFPTLKQLVQEAYEKGFSDIHVGVGKFPRFRDRGEIVATDYPKTNEKVFFTWLQEVLKDEEIIYFQNNLHRCNQRLHQAR